MHVRIIHQYFRLPEEGGSLRTYYLAKALIDSGFQVSIITATNKNNAHELVNEGISVYYTPVYYSNHLGFYSRVHAFLRFVFLAIQKNSKLPDADINYVVSTPLTTGLIGLYIKRRLGIPYIFEAGDLWPEAPIALGILKNPLLIALARRLEKLVCRNAELLVGLSKPITEALTSTAPGKPALTITNFSSQQGFIPNISREEWKQQHAIPKENYIISYSGTIGMANHLQYLVDLERTLPKDWPVTVVIMGEGAQLKTVREYARNSERILFLPKGARQDVANLLGATDFTYISFYNADILNTGSPNKFFDAMAAGIPVIINFRGWLKELIESTKTGFSYDPEKPQEAVEKLRHYINEPSLIDQMRENTATIARASEPDVLTKPLVNWLMKRIDLSRTEG